MFRYIVALLLVSLYSKSSGAPVSGSCTDLSTLLTNLASTCENKFLSSQITNKLNDCHVLVPPYDEKKFQCMLFYDINKQLCEAVAASKLALTEDYTEKIQKDQDVVKLCTAAKDWRFTELGEVYKKYVSVVFNNPIRCARVCSVDNNDILNVESNFYCKYFKWGADMLHTQIKTAPTQSGTAVGAPNHLPLNTDTIIKKPSPLQVESNAQSGPDINVKNPVVVPKPQSAADIEVNHEAAAGSLSTPEKVKLEATDNVKTDPGLSNPEVPMSNVAPSPNSDKPATSGSNKNDVAPISVVSGEEIHLNPAVHNPAVHNPAVHNPAVHNPAVQTAPEKKQETSGDVDINNQKPKTDVEPKKVDPPKISPNSQVDKPISDADDYQNEIDADEVKGGLSDNQGGDDGDDGSLGDEEPKEDNVKVPKENKIESSVSQFNVNDISQKEYYPSDGLNEDDDHFFSFFLTAIILVVLLYVLYHNKSKVSKVIMGLIVEGRQTGRRRNSRGHAYKRLDTLEQAMSANSTAPPSKIIY